MKPHLLTAVVLFSAVLLFPANAFANQLPGDDNTDTFTNSNEFADDHPDYSKDGNWETNETELKHAHSEITNLMTTQNDTPLEQYTGPDIPLTMVYIDDDTLVVGLDTMAAYFDVPIEPEYLQFFLGIDEPVEIKYVEFQPESHSSQDRIKQWQDRYKTSCMPVKAGYQKVCEIYKRTMIQLHVPIPATTTTTPTTPVVAPPTQTTTPCDDSPKSNTCYYYKLYQDRCTEGKTYKRCGTYATMIKNAGYDLPTSSGTVPTPVPTPVPTYELQNIKTIKSGDSIRVSWDAPSDFTVKYYKMYVSENGGYAAYKGKITNTATSYTLSGVQEGKEYKFKIKMYYTNQQGSTSIKYFYSDVVSVPVTTPTCTGSQILQGNVCVDRCPASNEEWRNGMCIVVSCPIGQVIQNNVCITVLKPVVITPPIQQCNVPSNGTQTQSGLSCLLGMSSGILRGGEPIQITGNDDGSPSILNLPAEGTVGIVLEHNNTNVMLTNSHVVHAFRNVDSIWFSALEFPFGKEIGDVIADSNYHLLNTMYTDAALVSITDDTIVAHANEIRYNDDILNVTDYGNYHDLDIGHELYIAGRHNDGFGGLAYYNATIVIAVENKPNTHVTLKNMGVGSYPSQGGDSGAPIFTNNTDGTATFMGMHVGQGCAIMLEKQNDRLIDFGNCAEPPFKLFTPWVNIKAEFGLQN